MLKPLEHTFISLSRPICNPLKSLTIKGKALGGIMT